MHSLDLEERVASYIKACLEKQLPDRVEVSGCHQCSWYGLSTKHVWKGDCLDMVRGQEKEV